MIAGGVQKKRMGGLGSPFREKEAGIVRWNLSNV
jgi:hypothetical protein